MCKNKPACSLEDVSLAVGQAQQLICLVESLYFADMQVDLTKQNKGQLITHGNCWELLTIAGEKLTTALNIMEELQHKELTV